MNFKSSRWRLSDIEIFRKKKLKKTENQFPSHLVLIGYMRCDAASCLKMVCPKWHLPSCRITWNIIIRSLRRIHITFEFTGYLGYPCGVINISCLKFFLQNILKRCLCSTTLKATTIFYKSQKFSPRRLHQKKNGEDN